MVYTKSTQWLDLLNCILPRRPLTQHLASVTSAQIPSGCHHQTHSSVCTVSPSAPDRHVMIHLWLFLVFPHCLSSLSLSLWSHSYLARMFSQAINFPVERHYSQRSCLPSFSSHLRGKLFLLTETQSKYSLPAFLHSFTFSLSQQPEALFSRLCTVPLLWF